MDRWSQYLYEQHSEVELKDWAARLNMFRYFRAYGGHANDGDSLDVALKYESTEELVALLIRLGIKYVTYEDKPNQAVPGKKYAHGECALFPSLIQETKWIEQPGHCAIFGVDVFIWCCSGLMTISASAGSYIVTNEHILKAEKLENYLEGVYELVSDPPKDTKHYICPKYHPNIFN